MAKLNFLPGPVSVLPEVREAFAQEPVSHRGDAFKQCYHETVQRLKKLTNVRKVALLTGSGTLANEIVAWNLRNQGTGLVLANGEFGERLVDHANRHGLDFEKHQIAWGENFDTSAVLKKLEGKSWVWRTACETSTGILNPWREITAHCKARGIKVCLDTISAIGNTPLDLSDVHFATASSGKGLGAYAGIAIIFYNHNIAQSNGAPRYLDLATYQSEDSVPFTMLSNLLFALHAALVHTDYEAKFSRLEKMAGHLRAALQPRNLLLPIRRGQSNFIWTIQLPQKLNSCELGAKLLENGINVHCKNKYLVERNWIQISLMGSVAEADVVSLVEGFALALPRGNCV